ncbi:hypothetical protein KIH39_11695 [Telmatocola sphagniphila]|uniref:Uncharacterized protein n=1 Tax=Telmatocola sphagniphila TaxID=1123043 RepID=A0A8E6BB83_9BACT|nr:hypothetical protein [Telmatocola sphagniphila]QVL34536.1 hypothetical protein KIH39_11695 [Telmatocola sphagniphila]
MGDKNQLPPIKSIGNPIITAHVGYPFIVPNGMIDLAQAGKLQVVELTTEEGLQKMKAELFKKKLVKEGRENFRHNF